MKSNTILSLALLAVLASSASAAASQSLAEPIALPTYVVEAPRLQLAEQRLNASLNALRAKADSPAIILLELPALKARTAYAAMRLTPGHLVKS